MNLTDEQKRELRVKVAELFGYTLMPKGSSIEQLKKGMSVTCENCKATWTIANEYDLTHERATGRSELCHGGNWTLFKAVWLKNGIVSEPPYFQNSLDAMAEAESQMSDQQHKAFREELWRLTDAKVGIRGVAWGIERDRQNRARFSATATERAMAFIKVMEGKA